MGHAPRPFATLTLTCATAMLGCIALSGCDDAAPTVGVSSASSAASSAVAAKPKASMAPVGKPKPLDLETIKKSLRCGGKAASGPCPVLEKFTACREKWSPITVSGDGRWIGHGSIVKKGKFVEEYFIMRARRVGLATVAPGALGVKIAITESPADLKGSAGKAFRALDRGDTVKQGNHAVDYVNNHKDWPESYAQQADSHQIFVADGAGTYLCGDSRSQALHVVRLSSSREQLGDGIYATLYPTKW